jgi:hypothetical protein
LDATEAVVEDDGSVVFRVAPAFSWFVLHPLVVADAEEEADEKELRVEFVNGGAIVIETLSTNGGPQSPEIEVPPTQKELRKAKGRQARERARYEALERARREARDRSS